LNHFDKRILEDTGSYLFTRNIQTVQVNVGLLCNNQCVHCHLQAGSHRNEIMKWRTMQHILNLVRKIKPKLIDITGGAPEFNPFFTQFITALKEEKHKVQVRTNLTVLLESGMEKMFNLFQEHKIKLVASLPCYLKMEVDSKRGEGVFDKSIRVLKLLNYLGYGYNPQLELDLVFNPDGAFLPPKQSELEVEYRAELYKNYGIVFNRLITITNMPVGRFLTLLQKRKLEKQYKKRLREAFNPQTIDKLMCQHQISIGWDGKIYNCDFNLALGLFISLNMSVSVQDFSSSQILNRKIITGDHCFGCTAGYGSSCEGALYGN